MKPFHIRIVGGWCGNRMVMVQDVLEQLLTDRGYSVKIDQQSIWESRAVCPTADLMLQLLPAFTEDEVHCQLLSIRSMTRDLNHPETIENILHAVDAAYPNMLS